MKFELEKPYWIRFYDHVAGDTKPMLCELVGWVMKDREKYVVISPWNVIDKDCEVVKRNREPYTILKPAIKEWKRI